MYGHSLFKDTTATSESARDISLIASPQQWLCIVSIFVSTFYLLCQPVVQDGACSHCFLYVMDQHQRNDSSYCNLLSAVLVLRLRGLLYYWHKCTMGQSVMNFLVLKLSTLILAHCCISTDISESNLKARDNHNSSDSIDRATPSVRISLPMSNGQFDQKWSN